MQRAHTLAAAIAGIAVAGIAAISLAGCGGGGGGSASPGLVAWGERAIFTGVLTPTVAKAQDRARSIDLSQTLNFQADLQQSNGIVTGGVRLTDNADSAYLFGQITSGTLQGSSVSFVAQFPAPTGAIRFSGTLNASSSQITAGAYAICGGSGCTANTAPTGAFSAQATAAGGPPLASSGTPLYAGSYSGPYTVGDKSGVVTITLQPGEGPDAVTGTVALTGSYTLASVTVANGNIIGNVVTFEYIDPKGVNSGLAILQVASDGSRITGTVFKADGITALSEFSLPKVP